MGLAIRAYEAVLGEIVGAPDLLAAGRTSEAWQLEQDGNRWVARVPLPDSGRVIGCRCERSIGRHLAAAGHPVAEWTVVEVDGTPCSVGPLLAGSPVDHGRQFTAPFAAGLARTLHDLHHLPARGYGPLDEVADELVGTAASPAAGVCDRWSRATIWPFDGSPIVRHVISTVAPDLVDPVADRQAAIVAAASGPYGVVHSDLHRDHLLCAPDGSLGGVLDFGDAFVGALAWDFALLHWYHGASNADMVAAAYGPLGTALSVRGRTPGIAFGMYKLAKDPSDRSALARLRRLLGASDAAFADGRLAPLYDLFEGERDDLDAYEVIVDELGARSVLDIGCGTGELATRLARRGVAVTGVDPAPASLAQAVAKPAADRVTWITGDATALPPMQVDLATMTGNVAQVFLTDDEWAETLRAARRALHPSGHLVFETRDPARRDWERWTPAETRSRVTIPDGDVVETWCEVTAVERDLVTFRWTNVFESDGAPIISDSTLRFRTRDEVEHSLDQAGFDVVDVRDAPDRPGREMVFVARRADDGKESGMGNGGRNAVEIGEEERP